jgi:hypothetical protein
MFGCCSSFDMKSICEKFNLKITQTENGIQINAEPKDKTKIKSFQKFIESWKDLCDGECKC